ncbi:MAG: hypothetical protein QXW41_08960 [Fervidicoccaceae archaeon]
MRIPKYAKFEYTINPNDKITINIPGKWLGWEYVIPSAAIPYIYLSIDDGDQIPLSYLPVKTDFSTFTIFNNSQFTVKIRVIILQEGIELYGQNIYSLISQYDTLKYSASLAVNANKPWDSSFYDSINLGTFNLGSRTNVCISYLLSPSLPTYAGLTGVQTVAGITYVKDNYGNMWSMPVTEQGIVDSIRICRRTMSIVTLIFEMLIRPSYSGTLSITIEASP